MEALGVGSVTPSQKLENMEEIKRSFPRIPNRAIHRPVGEAAILLSMSERHLHGSGGEVVGSLRLEHTPFG